VDHQCNGGSAPGSGCTAHEQQVCSASGQLCKSHACTGG
jgi:hypothetical protein